jgi:hypothetical protein
VHHNNPLQGTLRQWVPVGALQSLMWVPLQLQQGRPATQALTSAAVTWLLSCCLAAAFEVWMRFSYMQGRDEQQGLQQGGSHSPPTISRLATSRGGASSNPADIKRDT